MRTHRDAIQKRAFTAISTYGYVDAACIKSIFMHSAQCSEVLPARIPVCLLNSFKSADTKRRAAKYIQKLYTVSECWAFI